MDDLRDEISVPRLEPDPWPELRVCSGTGSAHLAIHSPRGWSDASATVAQVARLEPEFSDRAVEGSDQRQPTSPGSPTVSMTAIRARGRSTIRGAARTCCLSMILTS